MARHKRTVNVGYSQHVARQHFHLERLAQDT
jgi:hypothetical protein